MFVVSKRNFKFRTPDGDYTLAKDYMGDVPDFITEHPLFKAGVQSGWIVTPAGHSDTALYKADETAMQRALEADIRPDAPKKSTAESEKGLKKASTRRRTAK